MKVIDDIYGRRFYPFADETTKRAIMAAQPYIEVTTARSMPDFAQVQLNICAAHLSRAKWEIWKAAVDAAYDFAGRLHGEEATNG